MPVEYRRALAEMKAQRKRQHAAHGSAAEVSAMGKITGFLEYRARGPRLRAGRGAHAPLARIRAAAAGDGYAQPGGALHELRHSLLPGTGGAPARRAARSTTRSRTGTTSSIAATGKRRRATCTRPTIFPKSPAASARRRARRPARSTSTTIRSPSRRSNAPSPTAPSRKADQARAAGGARPARRSPSSARARPGMACAQQLARAGHDVHVYEKYAKAGGLLRYGIPDFKMEKHHVDRRVAQMEAEGVTFHYGAHVGVNVAGRRSSLERLRRRGARRRRREGARPADPGPRARGHPFRHGFPAAAEPPRQRRAAGRRRADPRQRQARRRHRRRRYRLRLHRHLDPPGRAVGDQFRDHAAAAGAREQDADLAGLAAEAAHLVEPRGRRRARFRGADARNFPARTAR